VIAAEQRREEIPVAGAMQHHRQLRLHIVRTNANDRAEVCAALCRSESLELAQVDWTSATLLDHVLGPQSVIK
jgi:hypothetical protein